MKTEQGYNVHLASWQLSLLQKIKNGKKMYKFTLFYIVWICIFFIFVSISFFGLSFIIIIVSVSVSTFEFVLAAATVVIHGKV